jgi:hypothetical protein
MICFQILYIPLQRYLLLLMKQDTWKYNYSNKLSLNKDKESVFKLLLLGNLNYFYNTHTHTHTHTHTLARNLLLLFQICNQYLLLNKGNKYCFFIPFICLFFWMDKGFFVNYLLNIFV